MDKLHVTIFAKQGAEKWVRHAYNIPAYVGCWQPYRVLLTSNGGTLAYSAFYTVREFKLWLARTGRKLSLNPHHRNGYSPAWVARFGSC
jgi:hypothetical protein